VLEHGFASTLEEIRHGVTDNAFTCSTALHLVFRSFVALLGPFGLHCCVQIGMSENSRSIPVRKIPRRRFVS
jgi:hypothetical protein